MARNFDGANDRVLTASNAVPTVGAQYTLMAWLRPANTTTQVALVLTDAQAGTIWRTIDKITSGSNVQFQTGVSASTTAGTWATSASFATAIWSHVAVTHDSSNINNDPIIYVNGAADTVESVTPAGTFSSGFDTVRIGEDEAAAQDYAGGIAEVAIWDVVLSPTEIANIYNGMSPLAVRPDRLKYYAPLFGTTTAEPDWGPNRAAGTVTGTTRLDHPPHISAVWLAAPQRVQRIMGAAAFTLAVDGGTYSVTGTVATLRADHKIGAVSGTYSISGTASTLQLMRRLAAVPGSYTWTGTDATLIFTSAGNFTLAVDAGGYALTGTPAGVIASRRISAVSGSYAWTGTVASLAASHRLSATAGSYSLTGALATLFLQRRLAATGGSYSWTGSTASLKAARKIGAVGGSYFISGTDATLLAGLQAVIRGSFELSGEVEAQSFIGQRATAELLGEFEAQSFTAEKEATGLRAKKAAIELNGDLN